MSQKQISVQASQQVAKDALPAAQKLMPLGAMLMLGLSPLAHQVAHAQAGEAPATPAVAASAPAAAEAASAPQATGSTAGKQLAPVKVQAGRDKPDGAKATTTRVGKVLQDPHDVPQAVTTVTNSIMQEQQVGSLREALRNVSGLSFNAAEGGRSGDNMNLRGFYTFGDMYLDGIRDTAQYNRETFNLEQVDVLRGAGAMLFGRGQAGGVINQVSKTPLSIDEYKLTGSIGTHDYREVTADLNKVFSPGTAVRVNLMQRDEGSWRSNPVTGTEAEIHRQGAAISLGLNLDSPNKFWLNHYWARNDDNPDYGISFDTSTRQPTKNFSPDTFWATDRNFDKGYASISTLVNEYKLSADSQLRSQLRVADYKRSYWARTPSATQAPNAGGLIVNGSGVVNAGPNRTFDYETVTLQSDFSTRFDLLGMKHEALAGVEYLNENSFRNGLENFGGTTTSNPPVLKPFVASTTATPTEFTSDSYAAYAQDTVEFLPKWKATAGVRRDYMSAEYSSTTAPVLKYGENSYRASVSHHPEADSHYYLAWSDSFSPTADLYQLTATPQPPERSEVIELGAKYLLLDGDLALRAAVYQATKNWERSTDLESTAAILTKKRRTRGLELEAAGRLTDDWELFAGLSLMNAKILEVAQGNTRTVSGVLQVYDANPEWAGKRARNTPDFTLNLWSTYAINGMWKVGGGMEAKTERYAFVPSSDAALPTLNGSYHPNTAPGYVRWDAMVEYQPTNKVLLRLNVKNVLDEVYYDSVYDNGGFAVPGPRRTVIASVEYKF